MTSLPLRKSHKFFNIRRNVGQCHPEIVVNHKSIASLSFDDSTALKAVSAKYVVANGKIQSLIAMVVGIGASVGPFSSQNFKNPSLS